MIDSYDEFWPVPWRSIEYMLKTYGGWSRMFKRSLEAVDKERVIAREGDPRFWELYAQTLADEQFEKEVKECYVEFVREYGRRGKPEEIRMLLAKALLKEGWKPNKSEIKRKIVELRKQKREEINSLRASFKKLRRRKK